jgi:hypothetical protein
MMLLAPWCWENSTFPTVRLEQGRRLHPDGEVGTRTFGEGATPPNGRKFQIGANLGGVARSLSLNDFLDEAERHFAFLVEANGFSSRRVNDIGLVYATPAFSVEVIYDESEGRVVTLINSTVESRHPRAGLSCLYVEAKLGPAQHVREIARTSHSLAAALASQASALQALLPILNGPARATLLLGCHGR